jgi:hypothetical protein
VLFDESSPFPKERLEMTMTLCLQTVFTALKMWCDKSVLVHLRGFFELSKM